MLVTELNTDVSDEVSHAVLMASVAVADWLEESVDAVAAAVEIETSGVFRAGLAPCEKSLLWTGSKSVLSCTG